MIKRFPAGLVLLVLLAAFSLAARAQEEGVIVESHGEAKILSGDTGARPAAAGGFVLAGEAVETGEDGRVRIVLPDDSELVIQPSSRVEICDSRANPGAVNTAVVYIGRLWASIAASDEQDTTFEVQTPTSVAGVRGTVFDIGVGPDGSSRLGVEDGKVRFESPGGALEVGPDLESMIEFDLPPSKPRTYEPGDEGWNAWHDRRREALFENPEPAIAWMRREVERGPDRIKRYNKAIDDDGREWEDFRAREKLDERTELTPELRADAARRLGRVYASTRGLQQADRRMLANDYLLERLDGRVRANPRAYPPKLVAALDDNMPAVRKVEAKKRHRDAAARERKAVDRADQITRKHNLDRDLKRRAVPDRKERLKQGKENFERRRGPDKDKPGPKTKPGDKPGKGKDIKQPGGKDQPKSSKSGGTHRNSPAKSPSKPGGNKGPKKPH